MTAIERKFCAVMLNSDATSIAFLELAIAQFSWTLIVAWKVQLCYSWLQTGKLFRLAVTGKDWRKCAFPSMEPSGPAWMLPLSPEKRNLVPDPLSFVGSIMCSCESYRRGSLMFYPNSFPIFQSHLCTHFYIQNISWGLHGLKINVSRGVTRTICKIYREKLCP